MSSCKTTVRNSDEVFKKPGYSSLLRFQSVLAIVVLILCVHVISVRGQHNQPTCGKRQVNTVFLLTKAAASPPGRWPWHAAIYVPILHKLTLACGGSIIGRNTVLSAAHCFFSNVRPLKEEEVSVHVGRVDASEVTSTLQVFVVSELIIHPEFTVLNFHHDIAIVKLASDITMTRFVQPICLWDLGDNESQIVGKHGTVIGFGLNERDELPGFLQEATLPVVDKITCLMSDPGNYGPVLTHDIYCAGGTNGVSACNGDSGGGMFFEIQGTWYVRGIVSFIPKRPDGSALCDSSKYTGFTDVAQYQKWVSQYMPSPLTDVSKSREKIDQITNPKAHDLELCKDTIDRYFTMCNIPKRYDHGFLFVITHSTGVFRVPLNGGASFLVTKGAISGMSHDCTVGRFYFSALSNQQILNANYDGTDQKPFITEDISWPTGVAVDWISRRLYWNDIGKKTIEVASMENPDVRTVLVSTNLVKPNSIAVDPIKNKLYWSDIDENTTKIEWSNLDGTERQVLLESPQITYPANLKVSMVTGELCYNDALARKIECIDPETKQIRTIVSNIYLANGLTATDELFYWSTNLGHRIESINMNGVRQEPITSPIFTTFLYDITVVTDKCPLIYSPCAVNNGGCPENTICLVKPQAWSGKICKCTRNCTAS